MAFDKKTIVDALKNPQWRFTFVLLLLIVFLFYQGQVSREKGPEPYSVTYSQFIEQLDEGNVKSVTITSLQVTGEFINPPTLVVPGQKNQGAVKQFITFLPAFQGDAIMKELQQKKVLVTVEPPVKESLFWQFVVGILPWIIIIGVWIYFMKRSQQMQGGAGGLFAFRSSKAKLYDTLKPSITFMDVAGMDNVKQELRETVEFLKAPAKFIKFGARVPKGVLLMGAPGTGKTLLARAVAGEAEVPFYSISASEFIEMFVGVGASRVRDMFQKAKAAHPSIIFIDEIDSIGRTRGAGLGSGHDEREQTLNQLLSEMDGFEAHEEVIVMAATNRPDVLDPALLRPGRFDKHIVVDRPGWKERKAILQIHTRTKKLAQDVDLENIARGTTGMTGADLENLANEAALTAIRKNEDAITARDFEEAKDKILMGTVREETISEFEKRITAYHESGHALVALELPNTDPVHKVSIVPRGMAMGMTQMLPEEDRHYYPKAYLMSKLSVALGGRAAERSVFNDVSSGAQSDLKEATSLAEKMVAQWGMSERLGPVNFGRGEEHPFLGRELAMPKRYSEEMSWIMDQEIQKLMVEAEAKAVEIIEKNRDVLDNLASALLQTEVLEKSDVARIVRESRERRAGE